MFEKESKWCFDAEPHSKHVWKPQWFSRKRLCYGISNPHKLGCWLTWSEDREQLKVLLTGKSTPKVDQTWSQ